MVRISLFISGIFLLCQVTAQEDTISFSTPQKLGTTVNSSAEESLPILSGDGGTLYFARTYHPENVGGKFTGQDIWTSNLSGGKFSNAASLSVLNDRWSNAVVGVANGGKRLYLLNKTTSENESVPGISMSGYNDSEGIWAEPTAVEVPGLEILGAFYSAYVSPDESFILWTLPVSENDSLGNDLYVSEKTGDSWSAPASLGAAINTDLNEISPFFDPVTELLFFSTNGRGNDQNFDIYYAKRLDGDWSSWSMPVKADFNSTDFDAYFFMASDSTAYFSSNRGDTLTNLYLTEVRIEPIIEEVVIEEIALVDTLEPIPVDTAALTPKPKKDPVLIVELDGVESNDKTLESLTREELLDPNTIIRFVYFDYDKFNITAKYIEVLDDVAGILDDNQDVIVNINGHTDAVASESYNQILSENRAASTKEWLMINGVEPDRIKIAGYGEREPYASNMTEEGRSLNRRVEIFFEQE